MVLEVAAFFVFIFGALGAIYGTYSGIRTTDFIVMGFGGIVVAFFLLAFAEFLQLLMKIEYNTRKADVLLAKGVAKKVTRRRKTTRKRK
jgi:sulfite exporter TauE/SafE